jgi:hypothetical protein
MGNNIIFPYRRLGESQNHPGSGGEEKNSQPQPEIKP